MPRQIKKEEKKVLRVPDLLITPYEFNRRKRIWDEYYAKVKTTHAYKRFIKQNEAFKNGDFVTVKRLALEAKQEIIDGKHELIKPTFPDPELERVYGRLGIRKEDIVSEAENIFATKEQLA